MNLIIVKVKLPKIITADELRYKHGFGTNMQGCDVSNGECFLVYPLGSVGEVASPHAHTFERIFIGAKFTPSQSYVGLVLENVLQNLSRFGL